jgi:hypothetical protein
MYSIYLLCPLNPYNHYKKYSSALLNAIHLVWYLRQLPYVIITLKLLFKPPLKPNSLSYSITSFTLFYNHDY